MVMVLITKHLQLIPQEMWAALDLPVRTITLHNLEMANDTLIKTLIRYLNYCFKKAFVNGDFVGLVLVQRDNGPGSQIVVCIII